MYDYLIVGAGLYGAVFAQEAKRAGKSVLVIDKRPHIAGQGLPRHLCRAAVWGRARNDGAGDPDHSGKRRAV